MGQGGKRAANNSVGGVFFFFFFFSSFPVPYFIRILLPACGYATLVMDEPGQRQRQRERDTLGVQGRRVVCCSVFCAVLQTGSIHWYGETGTGEKGGGLEGEGRFEGELNMELLRLGPWVLSQSVHPRLARLLAGRASKHGYG
ncbi:hypothetical protein LX36DRAFT_300970 [Colletotrichum falcatum]|nr:hypothetical protein LX36DRAFT_300970 [Colletotrichum falcatum]